MLIGGSGDDSINAYGGDDVLIVGSGVDDLFGGAGSDTFVLSSGYGFDVIRDFEDGINTIELNFSDSPTCVLIRIPMVMWSRMAVTFGAC